MEQDREESVQQQHARLVEDVNNLIRDARELATFRRRNSTLIAEPSRSKESPTHREVSEQVRRTGNALKMGVSRLLHEIGFLFETLEEHEQTSWPKLIPLKRDLDALVLRERPVSQIESDWVEDRLLAVQTLLGKIEENGFIPTPISPDIGASAVTLRGGNRKKRSKDPELARFKRQVRRFWNECERPNYRDFCSRLDANRIPLPTTVIWRTHPQWSVAYDVTSSAVSKWLSEAVNDK